MLLLFRTWLLYTAWGKEINCQPSIMTLADDRLDGLNRSTHQRGSTFLASPMLQIVKIGWIFTSWASWTGQLVNLGPKGSLKWFTLETLDRTHKLETWPSQPCVFLHQPPPQNKLVHWLPEEYIQRCVYLHMEHASYRLVDVITTEGGKPSPVPSLCTKSWTANAVYDTFLSPLCFLDAKCPVLVSCLSGDSCSDEN